MMEDLSLHILDIADNAIAAGAARIEVAVDESEQQKLTIRVADDSERMTPEVLGKSSTRSSQPRARRPGLGLALLASSRSVRRRSDRDFGPQAGDPVSAPGSATVMMSTGRR